MAQDPHDDVPADGSQLNDEGAIDSLGVDGPLADALRAADADPSDERWDALEELAQQTQRPDAVARLHRRVLRRLSDPEAVSQLARRAVRFHDEWYEDASPLVEVLGRVLAVDPTARWAFERLSLLLTKASRWDDLLALYDQQLAQAVDSFERAQLLQEAAQIAKDFAGQSDRAIDYLRALLPLRPKDGQLATSLERLYERQGRHRDLVELWTARLPLLPKDAALTTRARIAATELDHLGDPEAALRTIEGLAADGHDDANVCVLLDRVGASANASGEVRLRALTALRARHVAADRTTEVVRVARAMLPLVDADARPALHREIADRSLALGLDGEALEQLATLLTLAPEDDEVRAQLREVATRAGDLRALDRALVAAAERAERPARKLSLLAEAAALAADRLDDRASAIALAQRALALEGVPTAPRRELALRARDWLSDESQGRDRLAVLELLSSLESEADARKDWLEEAARLADRLGDVDHALAAWDRRLVDAPSDAAARDARIELLERAGRHALLVDALAMRAEQSGAGAVGRVDRVLVAELLNRALGRLDEAIEAWRKVASVDGPTTETYDALADLLDRTGRHRELEALLTEESADATIDVARRTYLLARRGEVLEDHLGDVEGAILCYAEALALDPSLPTVRARLSTRGDDANVAALAIETLAGAHAAANEWDAMVAILPRRLGVAASDAARAAMLIEAARIEEERRGDRRAAMGFLHRAFALAPADGAIEAKLRTLAEETGEYAALVEAYRAAIAAAEATSDNQSRAFALRMAAGALLESQLSDAAGALATYAPVAAARPEDALAAAAALRTAIAADRPDAAARTFVRASIARGALDASLVSLVDAAASTPELFGRITDAMSRALADERPAPPLLHALLVQLAIWHRDRRGDAVAAEHALLAAVELDATAVGPLEMLADLQRARPDRALYRTLLALADATGDDLDVLHEAASVAADSLADPALARTTFARLLEAAERRWSDGASERSGRKPEAFASEAISQLVRLDLDAGAFADAAERLEHGAALRFDLRIRLGLLHWAAEIAARDLADRPRASRLYLQVLDAAPADERALAGLSSLYEADGDRAALVALRRRELALEPPIERRLELRLQIAAIEELLGHREEQVAALSDNLAEEPGHPASLDALVHTLGAVGRWNEVADWLEKQGEALATRGEIAAAASVVSEAARVAETHLDDVPRALVDWARAVELAPSIPALDALARLHVARGEHAAAATRLAERLARSPLEDRPTAAIALARALVVTGDLDGARDTLVQALDETPGDVGLHAQLAERHRAQGDWAALTRLLEHAAAEAERAEASERQLAALRDAADVARRKLGEPARAVELLRRALVLAPTDRALRTQLADALRDLGSFDEARALLAALIDEFGRRRPPERAAVHAALAGIARAQGDVKEALAQLELASSMDVGNVGIAFALGTLAREAGDLARGESALRSLLLLLRRRGPDGTPADDVPTQAEVLFELHRIARAQGQDDRAAETLESAFEAASHSEHEARRLERALAESGDHAARLRALETRLAVTS
jgi:tetratricopeptide (TPR) repeat protein